MLRITYSNVFLLSLCSSTFHGGRFFRGGVLGLVLPADFGLASVLAGGGSAVAAPPDPPPASFSSLADGVGHLQLPISRTTGTTCPEYIARRRSGKVRGDERGESFWGR